MHEPGAAFSLNQQGNQYILQSSLLRGTIRGTGLREMKTVQMLDHVNPEHHLSSMIGYHLAWENSLVGMVMVQGKQREVVNIGLGIKQVAVEPRDATVFAMSNPWR
jgi:hypothetical protein